MPPSDPKLEAAGQEYSDAASEIDRLILDADRYYENKEFRDDKWAKGKALHPRLMESWGRFSKADKGLHDALDAITKPLAQRVLGRIEREDGKRFRWHRKNVLITARGMVEASDPIGDDDDVDVEHYSSTYTTFEQALNDLEAYGGTHKTELSDAKQSVNWVMGEANYLAFVKEANDFKKASKEYWRCLRDAPAKAKSPSGKVDMDKLGMCGGVHAWRRAEDVVKQYNEFINASNKRQFP